MVGIPEHSFSQQQCWAGSWRIRGPRLSCPGRTWSSTAGQDTGHSWSARTPPETSGKVTACPCATSCSKVTCHCNYDPIRTANEPCLNHWASKHLQGAFSTGKPTCLKEWQPGRTGYFSSGFLTAVPPSLLVVVSLSSQMGHAAFSRGRDTRCSSLVPCNLSRKAGGFVLALLLGSFGLRYITNWINSFCLPPALCHIMVTEKMAVGKDCFC